MVRGIEISTPVFSVVIRLVRFLNLLSQINNFVPICLGFIVKVFTNQNICLLYSFVTHCYFLIFGLGSFAFERRPCLATLSFFSKLVDVSQQNLAYHGFEAVVGVLNSWHVELSLAYFQQVFQALHRLDIIYLGYLRLVCIQNYVNTHL